MVVGKIYCKVMNIMVWRNGCQVERERETFKVPLEDRKGYLRNKMRRITLETRDGLFLILAC